MLNKASARRQQHPDEPWLWREEWAKRRMVYSNRARGLGLLAFAIVWTGGGSALAWMFIATQNSPLRWLMLLIPVAGLLFLYGGLRLAMLGFRYPQLILILDKVPIRPAERFAARVEARAIPDGKIRTSLSCVRGAGREDEQEVWTDAHMIARHEVGSPRAIPIDFRLPSNARETSEKDEIVWKLSVQIGEPGAPDVAATFEVPVFHARR